MSIWLLYLMTASSDLASWLGIGAEICGLAAALLCLPAVAPFDQDEGSVARGYLSRVIKVGVTCALLATLIPSKQGWYTILGGYYVTNLAEVKDLPPNVVAAANAFLENYAAEKPVDKK